MNENRYVKIKVSDLKEALATAFEAGWSGTPEMSESVVHAIFSSMDKKAVSYKDEYSERKAFEPFTSSIMNEFYCEYSRLNDY